MKIFDKRAALKQAETIDWEARQWGSQENGVAERSRTWENILQVWDVGVMTLKGKKSVAITIITAYRVSQVSIPQHGD